MHLAPPFKRNLAIHGCRLIDKAMVARELDVDEQALEVRDEGARCRFKWPTGTARAQRPAGLPERDAGREALHERVHPRHQAV